MCAAYYKTAAASHRPAAARPTFSEAGVAAAWNSKLQTSSESPIIANPLAAVFRQLDDDGSGNVDVRELKWMMQKVELSPAQIEAQLASFAANSKDISALEGGADQVSLAEWEKGLLPDTRRAIAARLDDAGQLIGYEQLADFSMVFRTMVLHFDVDGSGKLTVPELKSALEALRMGTDRVRAFVNVFVADRDGYISKKEFLECLPTEMLEELRQQLVAGGLLRDNALAAAAVGDAARRDQRSQFSIGM
jgi:Ca2+-binding EF-hand superfamily protein